MTENSDMKQMEIPRPRQLMDLPSELLEKIASYLDGPSLSAFALSHPRLEGICEALRTNFKATRINRHMMDYVSRNPLAILSLDLSNCHSDSRNIKALARRCVNLRGLHVVNSGLTTPHFITLLSQLKHLKSVSFTVIQSTLPQRVEEFAFIEQYPNIESVYVECSPVNKSLVLGMRLVNACTELKRLHICALGRAQRYPVDWSDSIEVSAQLWQHLQVVILSCHMASDPFYRCLIGKVFRGCALMPEMHRTLQYESRVFVYEHGNVNGRFPGQVVAPERLNYLKETYNVEYDSSLSEQVWQWGNPRKLKVCGPSPDMPLKQRIPFTDWPSTLVEVDLTDCHWNYSAEGWTAFVSTAPNVTGLAVPACFLPQIHPDDAVRRCTFAGENCLLRREVIMRSLDPLQQLKLKKLYVNFDYSCFHCSNCQSSSAFFLPGDLSGFKHLEELTMNGLEPQPNFFSYIVNPYVKTVKLSLRCLGNVKGLEDFLVRCRKLRNFKLESMTLPLHAPELWHALGAVSLTQLCLASRSSTPINLRVLRNHLPMVLKNIDTIHIHGSHLLNADAVRMLVENEIRKMNFVRAGNRIRRVNIMSDSLGPTESVVVVQNFPGRGICCVNNGIANIEPVGWHVDG